MGSKRRMNRAVRARMLEDDPVALKRRQYRKERREARKAAREYEGRDATAKP